MVAVSDPKDLGVILGVWAHPDDETYLSGGLMNASIRAGGRVVCVTATRGEAGSPDEERWPLATLGKVREAELIEALDHLRVSEHIWLGYADGRCHLGPPEEAIERIGSIIEEVHPDTVLTFGPEGMTGHKDHKAVCAWTTAAFERSSRSGATLYYATVTPEWAEEFRPISEPYNIYFEPDTPPTTPTEKLAIDYSLPAEIMGAKWRAIVAQKSQSEVLIEALGRDTFNHITGVERFRLGAGVTG